MRVLLVSLLCLACTSCPSITGGPADDPAAVTATERFVVDVREPHAFAAEHGAGSVNLQLGWNQLRERIGSYGPPPGTPLALRAGSREQERAALEQLAELGFEDVVVLRAKDGLRTLPTLHAEELAAALSGPTPPLVIDVRSRGEQARGHIEGALLLEQDEAPARLAELDPTASYAVICEGGYRSSALASLMRRQGFTDVTNVIDGMAAWREQGRAMVRR